MTKDVIIQKIFQTLYYLPYDKTLEIFGFAEYVMSKYQDQREKETSAKQVLLSDIFVKSDEPKKTFHENRIKPQLINDKTWILVENIKIVINDMIRNAGELNKIKNSDYISNKLHHNYANLTKIFSKMTGVTIENYIIAQKIELVKELLLNDDLNITEISYILNYSSVAHLSNQFKKITGVKPTSYKATRPHILLPLKASG